MNIGAWNILDLLEEYGEDYVNLLISEFSTEVEKNGVRYNLNPEIESFLKKMQFNFRGRKNLLPILCMIKMMVFFWDTLRSLTSR